MGTINLDLLSFLKKLDEEQQKYLLLVAQKLYA